MSDDKPKNKGIPSAYNQNRVFQAMVFALATVCFLRLDVLIGAAWMQSLFFPLGLITALLISGSACYLLECWLVGSYGILRVVSTFMMFIVAFIVGVWWLFFGAKAMITDTVSARFFFVLLISVGVVWFFVRYRHVRLPKRVMQWGSISMLFLCVMYLGGNMFTAPPNTDNYKIIVAMDSLTIDSKQYLLNLHWNSMLANSSNSVYDTFTLYECNAIAIACQPIYDGAETYIVYIQGLGSAGIGDLRYEDNTIRLYVDDELWFEQALGTQAPS